MVDLDFAASAPWSGVRFGSRGPSGDGPAAAVETDPPLSPRRSLRADEPLLRDQLGRLGGTVYRLRDLTATIAGGPMVARSVLNRLRRDLVARLDAAASAPRRRGPRRRTRAAGPPGTDPPSRDRQVRDGRRQLPPADSPSSAAGPARSRRPSALGITTIYADYQDIKDTADAVAAARRGGAAIYLATPRIEKPAEANLFRYLAKQGADGILVRNAGGPRLLRRAGHPVRGRLLAQRRQPADRRAAQGARGASGSRPRTTSTPTSSST